MFSAVCLSGIERVCRIAFCTTQSKIVVDFMNHLLDSVRVGQFPNKNRSESFVCSLNRIFYSSESWNARFSAESVRLSSSLVLIPKQITIVQCCKRLSINTTLTKLHVQNRDVVARLALVTSQSSCLHHLSQSVNKQQLTELQ